MKISILSVLKWFAVGVFIVLGMRLITSESIFGPMKNETVFLTIIALIILAVVVIITQWPIRKLVFKPQDHHEYIKKEIGKMTLNNQRIPGSIGPDGKILHYPPAKISLLVGDHHFMQYEDSLTHLNTNIIYDGVNDIVRGVIIGDKLGLTPSATIKNATLIIESAKTGVGPKAVITPDIIEKVVEKETPSQKKDNEPEKPEEKD